MNTKNRISIKRRARLFLAFFLPNQAMKYLGFIYGALLPSKKSYSSMGEDLIIEQYFKEKNILKGVYIDIGCFIQYGLQILISYIKRVGQVFVLILIKAN
tara:strand:+ start:578 stop:877 length:300 start_codon:yes stop_codon:yes gene_type:complete